MDVKQALAKATITIDQKVNPTPLPKEQDSGKLKVREQNDLMAAFFKVDPYKVTDKTNEKLSVIHEWAKKNADGDDEMAIVGALRDLKFKLGAPRGLVSHVDHVYKYVRLRQQAKTLNTQAKVMEQ